MAYQQQLKSSKWKRKRIEILERDKYTCRLCGDKKTKLQVHHIRYYKNKKAWEYHNNELVSLCADCHESIHNVNFDALMLMWLTAEKYGFDVIEKLYGILIEITKK